MRSRLRRLLAEYRGQLRDNAVKLAYAPVLSRSCSVCIAEVDTLVGHQDQINVCLFGHYRDRKDKHFE